MADIENCQCERIISLGGLIGAGNYNEEVIRFVRDNNIINLYCHHDKYNDLNLSDESQTFLKTLPEEIIESDIIYTRISPRTKKIPIENEIKAWNVFDDTPYRLAFVGHVGIPFIFGEKCDEFCTSTSHPFQQGKPFQLDETDRYIISVGSIGDYHNNKLQYVIYNKLENSVEFRIVEVVTQGVQDLSWTSKNDTNN